MGLIDKEKLIEEVLCLNGGCNSIRCKHNISGDLFSVCVKKAIKNFPEVEPAKKELPVKKVWTLKKEYHNYHIKMCKGAICYVSFNNEPEHTEFYDYSEEIDYSAIPKGSIVEISIITNCKMWDKFIDITDGKMRLKNYPNISLKSILSIRVVEWGNEK